MINLDQLSANHVIAVVDGNCALCSKSAQFIAKNDPHDQVRICPSQNPLGRALMQAAALDPDDPTSWLVLERGVLHTQMAAVIRLGNILGGVGRCANIFRILPQALQNRLYNLIARNRIKWFGTADLCAMPSAALKAKLITET